MWRSLAGALSRGSNKAIQAGMTPVCKEFISILNGAVEGVDIRPKALYELLARYLITTPEEQKKAQVFLELLFAMTNKADQKLAKELILKHLETFIGTPNGIALLESAAGEKNAAQPRTLVTLFLAKKREKNPLPAKSIGLGRVKGLLNRARTAVSEADGGEAKGAADDEEKHAGVVEETPDAQEAKSIMAELASFPVVINGMIAEYALGDVTPTMERIVLGASRFFPPAVSLAIKASELISYMLRANLGGAIGLVARRPELLLFRVPEIVSESGDETYYNISGLEVAVFGDDWELRDNVRPFIKALTDPKHRASADAQLAAMEGGGHDLHCMNEDPSKEGMEISDLENREGLILCEPLNKIFYAKKEIKETKDGPKEEVTTTQLSEEACRVLAPLFKGMKKNSSRRSTDAEHALAEAEIKKQLGEQYGIERKGVRWRYQNLLDMIEPELSQDTRSDTGETTCWGELNRLYRESASHAERQAAWLRVATTQRRSPLKRLYYCASTPLENYTYERLRNESVARVSQVINWERDGAMEASVSFGGDYALGRVGLFQDVDWDAGGRGVAAWGGPALKRLWAHLNFNCLFDKVAKASRDEFIKELRADLKPSAALDHQHGSGI